METRPSPPGPKPVIVVFDIGKTNKKVVVFDESYRVVYEQVTRLVEIADEDGFPCEDLEALRRFVFDTLEIIFGEREVEVKAINFAAYGSSLVYIDEDGEPIAPLYNYLKPYPEALKKRFFEAYGGESMLNKKSACQLEGSINAGLQLYRMKVEKPGIFNRVRYALHLPQYLSFLLSGEAFCEMTSIGCHTGLWDFGKSNYQSWVGTEGILEKLAPVVSADSIFRVSFGKQVVFVGAGLHDSSAALIPYLTGCKDPFLLLSTGTWCVSMNPFATGPLTAEELSKDCLCYLSHTGHPVKASRRMLGRQYETGTPIDLIVREQIECTRMAIGDSDIRQLFVAGGFSTNEAYMRGLRHGFSDLDVRAAELPHASALGAAMMIKDSLE